MAVVFAALVLTSGLALRAQQPEATTAKTPDIPASELLQPSELESMLHEPTKPLILQVGSHVLYAEAHVPGSQYAGAAGTAEGLQTLSQLVANLRKDQPIVIYCGCCPWVRCPNIRAAYQKLHALGFTHVKAVYIAQNFGTNWVDQGYPIEKGR